MDLKTVLEKYPRSTTTRSQFASILHDLFPSDKRSVNLVLAVYDSGIAARISGLKSINPIQQKRFVKQLIDDYGLQEQFANEGIAIWAKACGLICEMNESDKQMESPSSSNSIVHNADAYIKKRLTVNGSLSDYVITGSADGIILKEYRGHDKEEIIVPNYIAGQKVVGIGEYAFYRCTSLESLIVSDGIGIIEDAAFFECKNLKRVILPETLYRIGSYRSYNSLFKPIGAFENSGIKSIVLPKELSVLESRSFAGCESLTFVDLPNKLTEIKENTFYCCTSLRKVSLPDHLTRIEECAFKNCSMLKDIRFPFSLREIGQAAFRGCKSLSAIILNEGIKTIRAGAFCDCTSLEKVFLPKTVEIIEDTEQYPDVFGFLSRNELVSFTNDLLTIYCFAGSYGHDYARKQRYPIQNAIEFIE